MADAMSERMEQVSRAATERLLATQRDLAAARAEAAKLKHLLWLQGGSSLNELERGWHTEECWRHFYKYSDEHCIEECEAARAALEAQ